jgi:hypothetical protein
MENYPYFYQNLIILFLIGLIIGIVLVFKNKSKNTGVSEDETPDISIKPVKPNFELKQEESFINYEPAVKFPYILTDSVFTYKEMKLYESLKRITDELNLTIFTKMRIADLVYVPKNHPEHIKWFNYIRSKHVDFIICDNAHKPLIIIECDDKSHYKQSRKKRDEFVNELFRQVNLRVMHVMVWNDEELKRDIQLYRMSQDSGLHGRSGLATRQTRSYPNFTESGRSVA